jgi:hypothetical protein
MQMDDYAPNVKQTFTEDSLKGKGRKLICSYCRRQTNHKIEKSLLENWELVDDGMQGTISMLIVRCQGCDNLSFCKLSRDSETFTAVRSDDGSTSFEYIESVEQFPKTNTRFRQTRNFHSMPKEIKDAYEETYQALTNQQPKLGAAGTRLVIEEVCLSHGIKIRNLEPKIDKLHEKGIVTESMRDLLHNVRLFGNENVHTLKTPSNYQLNIAWEAVNNLLQSIYGTADSNKDYADRIDFPF